MTNSFEHMHYVQLSIVSNNIIMLSSCMMNDSYLKLKMHFRIYLFPIKKSGKLRKVLVFNPAAIFDLKKKNGCNNLRPRQTQLLEISKINKEARTNVNTN